ncbi:MAG: geranylgeranyl reductase family protein [Methanotrichaceae archaeon]
MYDVIIAGAGPAGSAAARTGAKLGLNTLVIEKESFPRYKPCGGALSERALSYLGFSLPGSICERNITGARMHYHGNVVDIQKDYRIITLVTRSAFDHLMLEKALDAGAQAIMGVKVKGYKEKDDSVEVYTNEGTYISRYLIIASGCQDMLKETVRGHDRNDQYGACMVADVPEDDSKIEERTRSTIDIHFGVVSTGYGWIFPHRGYYSVGIGGIASRLKHPKKTMINFLRTNGFSGDYKLRGHLIPFEGMERRISSKRVFLAGDSAGFVDAFTGEGISYAVRSGQIASEIIADDLPQEGIPSEYNARCNADFGAELKYALLFAKTVHSRPELFLKLLTSQEQFIDKYVEVIASRGTYKSYIRWLMPRIPMSLLSL